MVINIEGNNIVTKYNIGDKIIVYREGTTQVETCKFYKNKTSHGSGELEERPVEYVIIDIDLSVASGQYTYKLKFYDSTCIFPSMLCSVKEEEIISKI